MIELKECCKVPFPEKLFENYEIKENFISANVNASKVLDMMKRFVKMHDEPLFFILEIPCINKDDITESKVLHLDTNDDYDIYFVDGLDSEQACQYIDTLGNHLLKDGMNTFGIGGHVSNEEILLGKYNVLTIYTQSADGYRDFFNDFNIKETDTLITAWDTFDEDNPGECTIYVSKETGRTIYDIPEIYKEYGMYFYESKKEYDGAYEKEITFNELIDKILLVGITYYTSDNQFIEQKQYYGKVTEANDTIIRLVQNDGTELTLPPDLSSTKRAQPGEYKLRSTGEVVINPDFFATWNSVKDE